MKHLIQKIISLASLTTFLVFSLMPLSAKASTVSLTASSAEAVKGSAVVITLSLDTGGTPVYGYQADLSYSTTFFSSASIAMSPGTPFTVDPGNNDPDVASGGNIHFMRFYTSTKVYSGPVATITLQSNGTVGTTSLSFKPICPNTSTTSNCSAVASGTNTQLLSSVNNAGIKISEPAAAPAANIGAGSTTGKASSAAKGAKTTAPTVPATPANTAVTTKTKNAISETETFHKVTLAVMDQDGKPVKNAKVNLPGRSGTTDENGKVTFNGLSQGRVNGTVSYDGQTSSINLNVNSSDSTQTSTVKINIKKASSVLPIAGGILIALLLPIAFFLVSNKTGFGKRKHATPITMTPPLHESQSAKQEPLKIQDAKPEIPQKPAEKPANAKPEPIDDHREALHEKALDPGTVFTPSENRP